MAERVTDAAVAVELRWIDPQTRQAQREMLPLEREGQTLDETFKQWRASVDCALPLARLLNEIDWIGVGLNGKRARPAMPVTALDRIDLTLPLLQQAVDARRQRASLYRARQGRG